MLKKLHDVKNRELAFFTDDFDVVNMIGDASGSSEQHSRPQIDSQDRLHQVQRNHEGVQCWKEENDGQKSATPETIRH